MSTGEPDATENGHVRFGGGPSEKDQVNWHLVGGLPYRTPGSASGLGKRTGGNPGTAPQADSTRRFRLPAAVIRQAAPVPQHERVELLGLYRFRTRHRGVSCGLAG